MKRPSVMGIALAAGVFAFVWTLHKGAPEDQAVEERALASTQQWSQHTRYRVAPANADVPRGAPVTLEQLEDWAATAEPSWRTLLPLAYRRTWSGRENAREAWEQLVALAGDEAHAGAHFAAGMAHRALGDKPRARASFERARGLYEEHSRSPGLPFRQSWYRLGWASSYVGDENGARAAWMQAVELAENESESDMGAAYDLAVYHSLLGEQETGLAALRLAVKLGFADTVMAENDEDLALVRKHPEFDLVLTMIRANADHWKRRRRPAM